MKICVFGLWHLGSVTAACAAEHFETVGVDYDPHTIENLQRAKAPISEPGLNALINMGIEKAQLSFTTNLELAVKHADIVWIAFDTPVDDNDNADVNFVEKAIEDVFPQLRANMRVLISSQVPAGFTDRIAKNYRQREGAFENVTFFYSPENLQLGNALAIFRNPERIVVGTPDGTPDPVVQEAMLPFCQKLLWMSRLSAEMTKHAINAYLATTLTFINEIAALCECSGADARDVERGLRSDVRVGPRAYVSPGAGFAGGTLARDIAALEGLGGLFDLSSPLLSAIAQSNDRNKAWPTRTLTQELGNMNGLRIAVLGLAYKVGTDTLRRSSAVELCAWITGQGGTAVAYDPAVKSLPSELEPIIVLQNSERTALENADAVVIATEWPQFKKLTAENIVTLMKTPIVIDVKRFLSTELENDDRIRYLAVGKANRQSA